MKLHFDPNQEYQKEATKSIVDIFEGQPLCGSDFEFAVTEGSLQFSKNGVGNNIVLSEEQILRNLQEVQRSNGIEPGRMGGDVIDYVDLSVVKGRNFAAVVAHHALRSQIYA